LSIHTSASAILPSHTNVCLPGKTPNIKINMRQDQEHVHDRGLGSRTVHRDQSNCTAGDAQLAAVRPGPVVASVIGCRRLRVIGAGRRVDGVNAARGGVMVDGGLGIGGENRMGRCVLDGPLAGQVCRVGRGLTDERAGGGGVTSGVSSWPASSAWLGADRGKVRPQYASRPWSTLAQLRPAMTGTGGTSPPTARIRHAPPIR